MTKEECKSLPLKSMFDEVLDQIALTRAEYKFFSLYYMQGLYLQEVADEMCIDIQSAKRVHKKIKWKLTFVKLPKRET